MNVRALVVGIDAYVRFPLTSAVNDAVAFRNAVVARGLVAAENVTLLTAPPTAESAGIPDKDRLNDELFDIYDSGDTIDRLFFFFAGHGLVAFVDAAHSRLCTALVPVDVEDVERQGYKLINFDEFSDRLRHAGPREQFHFVDACRDLAYGGRPTVTELGWGEGPKPGPARAQARLFAAEELNEAFGRPGGYGVMTTYLLEALDGVGLALAHDRRSRRYLITAQSVRDHVARQMELAAADLTGPQRRGLVPVLDAPDPAVGPLREIEKIVPTPLSVRVEPPGAVAATTVWVSFGPVPRSDDYSWGPRRNGEEVLLEPQIYDLNAVSTAGEPVPREQAVDLRIEREAVVFVRRPDEAALGPLETGPRAGLQPPTANALVGVGEIFARAFEPDTAIEVERLEPPYDRHTAVGELRSAVPAGPYRCRFRFGNEVFSENDIFVREGETVRLEPSIAASQFVAEALGVEPSRTSSVMPSEEIGPMQPGVLSTLLPLVAVKPFDHRHEILGKFDDFVDARDPEEFGDRPLSVVIAVDGEPWAIPPHEVLGAIRGSITIVGPEGRREELALPRLEHPHSFRHRYHTGREDARERLGLAFAPAPEGTFIVALESAQSGGFALVCASLPERVTAVTLTLRPDGSFDLSQNLLRLPGRSYHAELVPTVGYERMVRQLQLAYQLYHTNELARHELLRRRAGRQRTALDELLDAKWTDPIATCMAIHSWIGVRDSMPEAEGKIHRAARNLQRFFGDLADARVVEGLVNPSVRERLFSELLDAGRVPVFAQHVHTLAAFAIEHGRDDAFVAFLGRRLARNQVWSLALNAEGTDPLQLEQESVLAGA